ncbi:hypothetical protein Goari_027378 [Gossypium aridum]|uniref:Uncharacterized protein n=1 Tax=Gossypium aridum TaxID=34290 RepID=A0A7J8YQQ7_GOSAI|nr:hypothetical protein [Gossypium aridum]
MKKKKKFYRSRLIQGRKQMWEITSLWGVS